MNHHSFFSDFDVARFGKCRIFIGEPHTDDRSTVALVSSSIIANDVEKSSAFHVAARILPAAEQYRRIREEEERVELHRFRTEGASLVTVDSLPYVYGESGEGMEQKRRIKDEYDICHVSGNISCSPHAIDHSDKVHPDDFWTNESGENTSEGLNEIRRNMPANIRRDYSDQSQDDGGIIFEKKFINGSNISTDKAGDLDTDRKTGCNPEAVPTTGNRYNNSCITSAEAIGSSAGEAAIDPSVWHSRRSESEVVLSRIKRKEQLALLKPHRRRSMPPASSAASPTGDGAVHRRRTTLRFAAAPVAANKRKRQKTLMDMFKR